jgi:hypothetical protein
MSGVSWRSCGRRLASQACPTKPRSSPWPGRSRRRWMAGTRRSGEGPVTRASTSSRSDRWSRACGAPWPRPRRRARHHLRRDTGRHHRRPTDTPRKRFHLHQRRDTLSRRHRHHRRTDILSREVRHHQRRDTHSLARLTRLLPGRRASTRALVKFSPSSSTSPSTSCRRSPKKVGTAGAASRQGVSLPHSIPTRQRSSPRTPAQVDSLEFRASQVPPVTRRHRRATHRHRRATRHRRRATHRRRQATRHRRRATHRLRRDTPHRRRATPRLRRATRHRSRATHRRRRATRHRRRATHRLRRVTPHRRRVTPHRRRATRRRRRATHRLPRATRLLSRATRLLLRTRPALQARQASRASRFCRARRAPRAPCLLLRRCRPFASSRTSPK